MKFTAACIQLNASDDLKGNIADARALIKQAAQQGAEFVTLPENAFLMEEQGKPSKYAGFSLEDHPGIAMCQELAKSFNIWILVGSVAISAGDGKSYNCSVLINEAGEQVVYYNKIHLFDVDLGNGEVYRESARIQGGDSAHVAALPWGKLGLTICYDVRFPQLYRELAQAGANILAVPAAFTAITGAAHWHVLLRARAIENTCFVIAPAQCGMHAGNRKTYGHSLIINPWGEVIAEAGEIPGIISAVIDMDQVVEVRRKLPSLTHDRTFALRGA